MGAGRKGGIKSAREGGAIWGPIVEGVGPQLRGFHFQKGGEGGCLQKKGPRARRGRWGGTGKRTESALGRKNGSGLAKKKKEKALKRQNNRRAGKQR